MKTPKDYKNNKVPEFNDRKAMWESLEIKPINLTMNSVLCFIEELKKLYLNGNIIYKNLIFSESEILDWYISRNQLEEMFFFNYIWQNPTIKQTLNLKNVYEDSYKSFEVTSAFSLGGSMAAALKLGGAYKSPSYNGIEIKKIGESAATELLNNNFDDTIVCVSNEPWCDFFCDVAWDFTWVVINKSNRHMHIILATDTD